MSGFYFPVNIENSEDKYKNDGIRNTGFAFLNPVI